MSSVSPLLLANFSLYTDMLATILCRFTFFVVVSPFIGPQSGLNPLVTHWMPRYGMAMQKVVVELDLGRKVGGNSASATVTKMARLAVESLVREKGQMEFVGLLCRRFCGESGVCEYIGHLDLRVPGID